MVDFIVGGVTAAFDAIIRFVSSFMPGYFLVVGVLMSICGLVMLKRRLTVLFFGVRTRGEIARWERQRDSENPDHYFYFPYIRYFDADNVSREMRVDMGYNSEKFAVGHPYDVRFDARNPARAYAANPVILLIAPVIVLAMGLLCIWIVFVQIR